MISMYECYAWILTSKVTVTSPAVPPVLTNGIRNAVSGPGPSSLTVSVDDAKLMNPFSAPVECTPGVHRAQKMATTPKENQLRLMKFLYLSLT